MRFFRDLNRKSCNNESLSTDGRLIVPKAAKSRKTKRTEEAAHRLACRIGCRYWRFLTASLLYYSGKPHDNEIIGLLGTNLVLGMEKLFGPVSIILPIFLILWAIHMTRARSYWSSHYDGDNPDFVFSVSLLCHVPDSQGILVWEAARSGLGGIIGGLITVVLMKLTGTLGTNLIMGISFSCRMVSDIKSFTFRSAGNPEEVDPRHLILLDRLMFYEEESKTTEPIIVGGGGG